MTGHRARVRVPATSANLGPGFDAVGLALARYDDVAAERRGGDDLVVEVSGAGADDLPRDGTHLVVRAMDATFAELGVPRGGLVLQCTNDVPHARGLGSSAAAVVAGILLARALVPESTELLDDDAVLHLATRLEGHPDNAAAALLGGFTIAWQDANGTRAVRLEPASALRAVVAVPGETLATVTARGLLPESVPHEDAAATVARSALLVHAVTSEPDLLLAATEDRLHQDYRAPAMPGTLELLRRLRSRGLAAVVSGAGPSVLVLGGAELSVAAVAAQADAGWQVDELVVDRAGAQITGG